MKKFYMTMVAMLCGAAAIAQTNELYVENIKVDKGTTEVNVPVCLKNSEDVTAVAFYFLLPDGVSHKTDRKGNPIATVDEDRKGDHNVAFTPIKDENEQPTGQQMISVSSMSSATFWPNLQDENDGPIVYVPVVFSGDDATYEIQLTHISIATPDERSIATSEETSFTIQVGEGTGIHTINAADVNAPVYNIAGQRVSKAQKGVYIQNGKKVAVK